MTDIANPLQCLGQQHANGENGIASFHGDSSSQQKQDAELAERLSSIIESTNEHVTHLCNMIRKVSLKILYESCKARL
jgi:hypothetical protein